MSKIPSHARISIPLMTGTGGYFGQQLDPKRLINMFVVVLPDSQKAIITIPGAKTAYTHSGGERTRRLYVSGDALYGIYETDFVTHDTDLNGVTLGQLNTSAGFAQITANNSNQTVIVDNVNGYIYDPNAIPIFKTISAPGFPSQPIDADFLDGHVMVAQSSSNKWFISEIDNAENWNALDFAMLTSGPNEKLQGIRVINRRIFIFGRYITEVWYNSGAPSSFPFIRDNNNVIPLGCAATGSIAKGVLDTQSNREILVWLASSPQGYPTIQITLGSMPEKISDTAIDYQLQELDRYDDANGYLYRIDGHLFYFIDFPQEERTFVYNFTSKTWHEQQMMDGSSYFSSCHAFFNGSHYLGHKKAAVLSELNSDYTTNDAEYIRCEVTTPLISAPTNERLLINRLILEARQGIGAKTASSIHAYSREALIYLDHSTDGGYTYVSHGSKTLGKVGETQTITLWDGFDYSDKHVFRLKTSQPNKTIILNAAIDMENLGY